MRRAAGLWAGLRRVPRLVGIAALVTMPGAACVQILGIEQPPTLVAPDAAATDAGSDVVCSRLDPSPCRSGCPHILCDDFESQPLAKNWQSYLGLPQPSVRAEGGMTQANGLVGGGLFGWCTTMGLSCLAGITHAHRRPPEAGVRARGYELISDLRLEPGERPDANPRPDLTQVLALLSGEGVPSGVVLSAADGHFFISGINNALVNRILIDPQGFTDQFPSAVSVWLRVSLFVGEPAGAASAGYRDCPASAETVFAARVDPLGQACRAAGPSETGKPFDLTGFLMSPLAVVGVASVWTGPAAATYDNVQLNLVP